MEPFILTVLDTTGIQEYVFGSNRLQENIGGSELVYRATSVFPFTMLDDLKFRHNAERENSFTWALNDKVGIEFSEDTDAEVIYAGGGNTMIIFRNREQALSFTQRLTRQVLRVAPGLNLVVQHLPFDFHTDKLPDVRNRLLKMLAGHKQSRLPSLPSLGLSVTAACESTGLAATRTNEKTRRISSEIVSKLGWRDAAQDRLRDIAGEDISKFYDFPSDIDNLGRIRGEESYVAVVHADGNRMGHHIRQIDHDIENEAGVQETHVFNREYIRRLRKFSKDVKDAGIAALKHIVMQTAKHVQWNGAKGCHMVAGEIPMQDTFLPFRPLVFGGDDVTFLCNGQLGLTLAVSFLKAFETETANRGLRDMHACAGIAMVKMHYPFSRAYNLSEQLCKSAKEFVRENGSDGSALDWHFASSGLNGSLKDIRSREYHVSDGHLTMRPVSLSPKESDQTGRYWEQGIERLILTFKKDENWIRRRNKVKGLSQVLRKGSFAAAEYLRNYDIGLLPELMPGDDYRKSGWSQRCVYFDAIELMDHYVPFLF